MTQIPGSDCADLFGFTPNPLAMMPVSRGKTDTSAAAGEKAESKALIYREAVLACVKAAGGKGVTTSECAGRLRVTVLTVRPRFTELKAAGLVADSGLRRANKNCCPEIVWVKA